MKIRAYVLMAPDGTYHVGGWGGPNLECKGHRGELPELYDPMSAEIDIEHCELSIVEADVEPPQPVKIVQGTVVT